MDFVQPCACCLCCLLIYAVLLAPQQALLM